MSFKEAAARVVKKLLQPSSSAERGFSSRSIYKARKQGSEEAEKARLIVADEGFGFSRRWCKNGGKKLVATCVKTQDEVQKISSAGSNMKELLSKGASVICGVDPAKIDQHPMIQGKNFNFIHVQFPEPNEGTKALLTASKAMLRGFGRVQVLVEPKKVGEIETMAVAAGLKKFGMKEFDKWSYEDYQIPADKDESAPKEQKGMSDGFKVLHFGSPTN